MVLVPPGLRPGVPRSLGNHEARIRALERLLRDPGWRFNVDNEGGWGQVVFNDSFEAPALGVVGGVFTDKTGEGVYLQSIFGGPQSTVAVTPAGVRLTADIGGTAVDVFLGSSEVVFSIGGSPILTLTG